MGKLIVAATIGNCLHVAGIYKFMELAELEGFTVKFLGVAIKVEELVGAIIESKPAIVALSYRLTADNVKPLLEELAEQIQLHGLEEPRYLFAGTTPVANVAKKFSFIDTIFSSESGEIDVLNALNQNKAIIKEESKKISLKERLLQKKPYPLLRHHFGLPDFKETVKGIEALASSGVLDIISIGPDQNTQEYYFQQELMEERFSGAGGVPLRKEEDFFALYEASQRGNNPLLRCYSGTNNLLEMSSLLQKTIKNAWAAIPLFWYNSNDGRSKRDLETSIKENQAAIAWHGTRNIPVEVNDSHQWSLRMSSDAVAVTSAFLSAYNAKKLGVKDYIAQFMFNTPPGTSPTMDLGKMLAKLELIMSLKDENFHIYKEVRAGLAGFPGNLARAKGNLAASTYLSGALKPDIVHVVAFCEAQYAARPAEIIESCLLVQQIYESSFCDFPNMLCDERVQNRKTELLEESRFLLSCLTNMPGDFDDPLTSPENLTRAVEIGILDAPQLKKRRKGLDGFATYIGNGSCVSFDLQNKRVISEKERVKQITKSFMNQ